MPLGHISFTDAGQAPTVRPLFTRGQTDSGQESHPSAAPPSPPSPFSPPFRWLPMSRSPAYYPAGWPAEPSGYGRGRSMLHQARLARRSQLPPQAGAWFSNSPLQFSSMRSGELLHAGTAASTPVWVSSLPRRMAPQVSAVAAPPVSVGAPPVPATAPCRQRQKPGAWRATSRWPAYPCSPPSSRRSRTREAAATWAP